MGINASKRVEKTLSSSPELDAACDAVYDDCLALAQHAFPGVRRYQLLDAAARLHAVLSDSLPLVHRWVPSPPGQTEVDSALRRAVGDNRPAGGCLSRPEFKAFAVELFRVAVLSNAGGALLRWAPAGMAGIAGFGLVARAGREVVGRVMGVYAVGVAAAVYASLTWKPCSRFLTVCRQRSVFVRNSLIPFTQQQWRTIKEEWWTCSKQEAPRGPSSSCQIFTATEELWRRSAIDPSLPLLLLILQSRDVLQAHVKNHRAVGAHSRPPWRRREALGERQLQKTAEESLKADTREMGPFWS